MIILQAALAQRQHVMARPPLSEFRTDSVKPIHKLDEMRVAGITAVIGTEPGKRVPGPCRPFDEQRAQRRMGENKPDQIPLFGGYLLEIEQESASGAVPSE